MAKSTYLELCQTVRIECSILGSIASVLSQSGEFDEVTRWVANADLETQGRWLDWDFLHVRTWSVNTVANTAAVVAPADLGTWDRDSFYLNYTLATHKKLLEVDYKSWRKNNRQGVKVSAQPSDVVILPDLSLVLEAPPDAVYSLSADYWKRPAKMTSDTGASPIPEEYERIIVARAKMMYAEAKGAADVMASSSVEFDDLLDKLEAKYLPGLNRTRRMSEPETFIVRPE